MFSYLAEIVTRRWYWTVLAWLLLVGGVRLVAPAWDDVTYDGDLAFLPADRPYVRGEQLIRAAFPGTRARSQVVVIAARDAEPLQPGDLKIMDRLAGRFHNRLGAVELARGDALQAEAENHERAGDAGAAETRHVAAAQAWEAAIAAFDEALQLREDDAVAFHNRAIALTRLGRISAASDDSAIAQAIDPTLQNRTGQVVPADAALIPLVDVWNRHHEVFGSKLRSDDKQAQLLMLQLSNEFMATDNIRVLELVEQELAAARTWMAEEGVTGLTLGISGSAAVGGDMLRAAVESIRHTELLTIVLVVTILLVVYRSPVVILVPLLTIAVALSVSTGLVALLTQLHLYPGFAWWGFKIFKTTRIFVVVILFGSGTDFCLFLIARLREELSTGGKISGSVAAALRKVGSALVASALTTILGLAMMYFAEFGKFRSSGPAIAVCLLVTLLACLTFSPALLSALGRHLFWPFAAATPPAASGRLARFWTSFARQVTRQPGKILLLSVVVLLPLAIWGWSVPNRVTFDLLSELPPSRTSIVGSELLKRHFPVGEGGPVIVIAQKPHAGFDAPEKDVAAQALAAVFDLTKRLRSIAGVHTVRSMAEPLGDEPEPLSLITASGRRKLFLRQHALTKAIFLAQEEPYRGAVTRFELVLNDNPFSLEAIQTLAQIDKQLSAESGQADSFWHNAEFQLTGTTAGIRDLREVIHSDYWRITSLVTLTVFGVIVVILRRPEICVYLIVSVLFSYLATIGATEIFFRWLYGATFVGLDWKVPIFLFVILVAVGEDYNIYLVTRAFEEQGRLGPLAGLREAVARTGGIITSCGIIMAGSFVSMIAGSLRGISELGFALTLGILLDTLVVRTLLVPAFLALRHRLLAHFAHSRIRRDSRLPGG